MSGTVLRRLDVADPRWAAFVTRRPEATIFHHPGWATALARSYGGLTPFVLALEGDRGIVQGLPFVELRGLKGRRRWVGLPFTDHCPPLSDPGTSVTEFVESIGEAARAAGVGAVEVRAELPAESRAWHAYEAVRHVLDLRAGIDELFERFHSSQVRRNIRRAEREGVGIEQSRSREALVDVFYRLHCLTRRRQGVPVQRRRFFERIWEELVDPGLGYVAVAHHAGVPCAAALFLSWNTTTVYKFGASDDRGREVRANHALFWNAIRTSAEEGRCWLDFGRTELDQPGLRAFKSAWAASELPLRYSSVGTPRARSAPSLGEAIARPLIRRSPVWVARAVGSIAYRHVA